MKRRRKKKLRVDWMRQEFWRREDYWRKEIFWRKRREGWGR